MFDINKYSRTITNYIVLYGMKILIALVILVVGLWLIKRVTNFLFRLMEKRGVDPSLVPFLHNIANIALKIMLLIVVISQIGIEDVDEVHAAALALGFNKIAYPERSQRKQPNAAGKIA